MRGRCLLFVLILCGCDRIASYGPATPVDSAPIPIDSAADLDAAVPDIPSDTTTLPPDLGPDLRADLYPDALLLFDGSPVVDPAQPCTVEALPADAIWVQRFEAELPTLSTDQTAVPYPADLGGDLSLFHNHWSTTNNSSACGLALESTSQSSDYGVVNDDLRLTEGRISLWVRFHSDGRLEGILSRDRQFTPEPGHLTLARAPNGHIVFRLQSQGVEDLLCSAGRAPSGVWHHIVVTFGGGVPPTLAINGDARLAGGTLVLNMRRYPDICTPDPRLTHGIEDNDLPLMVGALNWASTSDLPLKPQFYLHGALDEIVISGQLAP